jgi:DNA repair protein RAD57
VQLSIAQGGLNGSALYLTTSGGLPTPRLVQLLHEHPLLAGSRCTLDNVQTSPTKTVSSLLHILSDVLPASLLNNNNKNATTTTDRARSARPPLKLLVVDSIAELLHHDEDGAKTSTSTLAERSRNLSAIAAQLHALAATHQLAILALNHVTHAFDRDRRADAEIGLRPSELLYADQARIFDGRAEGGGGGGGGGGGSKSAALGLVWANQVNARIMLLRTERRQRRYYPMTAVRAAAPEEVGAHDRKRLRAEGGEAVRADDVGVRRLSIVFSSVCAPTSIDFVITSRGIETLAADDGLGIAPVPPQSMMNVTAARALAAGATRPPLADVSPLDVGSVASDFQPPLPGDIPVVGVEDDEDAYWREVDDFPFASDSIDVVQATEPS